MLNMSIVRHSVTHEENTINIGLDEVQKSRQTSKKSRNSPRIHGINSRTYWYSKNHHTDKRFSFRKLSLAWHLCPWHTCRKLALESSVGKLVPARVFNEKTWQNSINTIKNDVYNIIYRRADQRNWPITALRLRRIPAYRIEHCAISR